MTYESAFSSIINGGPNTNAMKRPSWAGYIYRTDIPLSTISAWVATTAYAVGDKVSVTVGETTRYYVCREAHTSGATFVDTNWAEITGKAGFTATYRERANTDDTGTAPEHGDGAVEYVATFSPRASGSSIKYVCISAPVATVSGSQVFLMIDKQLQDSLLANDWTVGLKDDFEDDRSQAGNSRW